MKSISKVKSIIIGIALMLSAQSSYALPSYCTHGANTCKSGYVWREAGSTDQICVTPQTRSATRFENRLHSARVNPNSVRGYCNQGFVWREAFRGDRVCVTPSSRARARYDNRRPWSKVISSCLIR